MFAGIGKSWYTWLEQGRPINVSESVAKSITETLRLSDSETRYVFRLLAIGPLPEPLTGDFDPDLQLDAVVDAWLPVPAVAVDGLWNLLSCNRAARRVLGIADVDDNLLVFLLTDPRRHERYLDPHGAMRRAVAQFRASASRDYDNSDCRRIIERLSRTSEEFAAIWHDHEVPGPKYDAQWVVDSDAGLLTLRLQSWNLADRAVGLLLWLPQALTDTDQRLHALLRSN